MLILLYVAYLQRRNGILSGKPGPLDRGKEVTDWIQGLELNQPGDFLLHAEFYRPKSAEEFEIQRIQIEIFRENGRSTRIQSRQGTWNEGRGKLLLSGNVTIKLYNGIQLTTDKGLYLTERRLFRSLHPVTWSWQQKSMEGSAQSMAYNEGKKILEARQGTLTRWTEKTGDRWRMEARSFTWDLTRGIIAVPTLSTLVRETPAGFHLICPHWLRQPNSPFGDLWRGWPNCKGEWITNQGTVQMQSREIFLFPEPEDKKVVLLKGTLNMGLDGAIYSKKMVLERGNLPGMLRISSPRFLSLMPMDEDTRIRNIKTRLIIVSKTIPPVRETSNKDNSDASPLEKHTARSMELPEPLWVQLEEGKLEAGSARKEGDRWILQNPITWTSPKWKLEAHHAVIHRGFVEFSGIPGKFPVRGWLLNGDEEWSIEGGIVRRGEDALITWKDNVRLQNDRHDLRGDTFTWSSASQEWTLSEVRQSKFWDKQEDRDREISIKAKEIHRPKDSECLMIRNDIEMTLWNFADEGPILMKGQKGQWCQESWSLEGEPSFRFQDLAGTGDRIDGESRRNTMRVLGHVQIRRDSGATLQGTRLLIDLTARRMQMLNPWPERGELIWPKMKE